MGEAKQCQIFFFKVMLFNIKPTQMEVCKQLKMIQNKHRNLKK